MQNDDHAESGTRCSSCYTASDLHIWRAARDSNPPTARSAAALRRNARDATRVLPLLGITSP
jgi:hypothetical protein